MCRKYVSGRCIDGVIYNKASRWWGKIFTDNDGRMVELDVVAESLDRKLTYYLRLKLEALELTWIIPIFVIAK